jgi:4-hydroxybenzoate polyprenyltransferase
MLKKISILLEMIKFKHTVFALPFAFMGAFLSARGVPEMVTFGWIILAMVGARTCAMGFNRIVDREFDKLNPRTSSRALPAQAVKLSEAWVMVILAAGLFFFACYSLNQLTLILSPFALGLTLFYSLTKRFTWLCHLVLGLALAFSPLGGWVAVSGSLLDYPYVLSLGVLFWVAGFDTLCQNAFRIAVLFHVMAFVFFVLTGILASLNALYYLGICITGAALFYQHIVVNPRDLSRIQLSFFAMNGLISLTLFVATWLSLVV